MVTTAFTKLSLETVAAFNSHDLAKLLSFYTNDCTLENIGLGKVYHGIEEARKSYSILFSSFPDIHLEIKTDFRVGDWSATEWVMTGTNKGYISGMGNMPDIPATNKKISFKGVTIDQYQGDKVIRETDYWNASTFMQQLGLTPQMGNEEDRTPG